MNNQLLYMQVKHQLRDMLAAMPAGQRLPSRNRLAERFGVTRTTIDRSVSELVGEGALYTRDGSGTYKADVPAAGRHPRNAVASWAVILPDIMHDTYPGILRGVEDAANENGANVMICNTDNLVEKQNEYIRKLLESRVSGIIIVPALVDSGHDLQAFRRLREEGIPFVFCNRGVEGIEAPRVISNNFYGGFLATAHLLGQGYHRIGFVSHPVYSASLERYQGYISALTQAGADIRRDRTVFEPSFSTKFPGYESTLALLERCPDTDALFCFNDTLALGACRAAEKTHRHIGRDIGIVGYDDTALCETLPIKLSSVRFKTYEAGRAAAQMLLQAIRMGGQTPAETRILQPELVVRASSSRK